MLVGAVVIGGWTRAHYRTTILHRGDRSAIIWARWRASDVRVAQQLATLAGLPLLAFTSLISFQLIRPSVALAIGLALALLVIDVAAGRVVSGLFDRERLITGRSR